MRHTFRTLTFILATLFFCSSALAQSTCTANPVTPVNIPPKARRSRWRMLVLRAQGMARLARSQVIYSATLPVTSEVLNASTGATEAAAVIGSRRSGDCLRLPSDLHGCPCPAGTFTVTITNVRVNAISITGPPASVASALFITGPTVTTVSVPIRPRQLFYPA